MMQKKHHRYHYQQHHRPHPHPCPHHHHQQKTTRGLCGKTARTLKAAHASSCTRRCVCQPFFAPPLPCLFYYKAGRGHRQGSYTNDVNSTPSASGLHSGLQAPNPETYLAYTVPWLPVRRHLTGQRKIGWPVGAPHKPGQKRLQRIVFEVRRYHFRIESCHGSYTKLGSYSPVSSCIHTECLVFD